MQGYVSDVLDCISNMKTQFTLYCSSLLPADRAASSEGDASHLILSAPPSFFKNF